MSKQYNEKRTNANIQNQNEVKFPLPQSSQENQLPISEALHCCFQCFDYVGLGLTGYCTVVPHVQNELFVSEKMRT